MKVAVVGAGVAGISAAWHLDQGGAEVHLIESGLRIGGHTHTHTLSVQEGTVNVDTGFIVFNEHNYPNFSGWLTDLGVAAQQSNMSFAVRDEIDWVEYGTTDLRAMTANTGQLVRPAYWRMWRDILRFYKELREGDIPNLTLGQYLNEHKYSDTFVHSHIAPMCAALWSQPAEESINLSLKHVVEFMRNHRMLQIAERPDWQVLQGGSSAYLQAFADRFGGHIHTNTAVTSIERRAGSVFINGNVNDSFDVVVLACHSDQALEMLNDASPAETEVLGAIPYQRNDVYLHGDLSFMPKNRACWSSWNVTREHDGTYTITYWMNKLQGLTCNEQFFVTLNPSREPNRVRWQGTYHHPHFTREAIAAQSRWTEVSRDQTYFAGAYWGSGFHEDGFVSGQRSAAAILNLVAEVAAA